MAMEELIAYVVLLSLPLWLLVEQLLFIRMTRPRTARKETRPRREPQASPQPGRPAPARGFSWPLRRPLRSSQR
ncbi:MAG TPA: hypothetical protein VJU81_11955 [Methylomirabilota bacterium]|nr:hypothetical protein [Methylomirabilota bacterium]